MNTEIDATQTGVSADDAAAQVDQQTGDTEVKADKSREKTLRESGMEMMEARRREQLVQDGLTFDKTEESSSTTDIDEQFDAQTESVFAGDPSKTKVKIKIDGQDQLVSLADITAKYQKGGAADKRLEEATRMQNEATRLLEEAKAERANATTTTGKKTAEEKVTNASEDVQALTEKKKRLFDAMYSGEEETAQQLFDEVMSDSVNEAMKGRGNATLDEQALIARVTPAIKQSLEVGSALKQFQKDFPTIATDPYLASKADEFLAQALTDGKSHEDAFKFAGNSTQDWLRNAVGVKSPAAVETTRTERAAKKDGIDNLPSASARTTAPEAAGPQPVSSVIAGMRQARMPG